MARVLRLIEECGARPVRMAELCAHAGVSGRTLHAMFQQVFRVSPMRYVRIRKLHMLRAALILANADGLTISRTCASLGISDCGRCAADYRRLFGEYPSETLARRRGNRRVKTATST